MLMRSATGNHAKVTLAAAIGLQILGLASTPAHADSIRSQQWYLDAMQAEEMWKTSTGSGVTVAVIDSGVDVSVPDLHGQVLEGRDFTGQLGGANTDTTGHGTRMALFIGGTGKGEGIFGLAPGVKILPLRASGTNNFETGAAAIASAIRFAADSDAKVLNISLSSPGEDSRETDAINYALKKGKLVFAGVGNSGDKANLAEYPAATQGVVGIGAVDRQIKAAAWSQHGAQVVLAAPGSDMVGPCTNGTPGLCTGDGTSDATALASASAALIWSVHPDWTANQVLRVLINTAGGPKSGEKRSDTIGYGVVRPRIALQNPGDPGPADVSPLATQSTSSPSPSAGAKPTGTARASSGNGLLSTRNMFAAGIAAVVALAVAVPLLVARRRKA
ncbi:type VII secretion-associated serine protease mycosin [Streptoverticillium reticulum]|uniref:type VII secretion-associated serine protease mycosin n=1 Tax=Streptoverticillium reticulum TaxID=1433415 RepID=UPI0039BF2D5B